MASNHCKSTTLLKPTSTYGLCEEHSRQFHGCRTESTAQNLGFWINCLMRFVECSKTNVINNYCFLLWYDNTLSSNSLLKFVDSSL